MLVHQVPVAAECDDVNPVFVPRDRCRRVVDVAADGLPAGPTSAVPRSMLQAVVVDEGIVSVRF